MAGRHRQDPGEIQKQQGPRLGHSGFLPSRHGFDRLRAYRVILCESEKLFAQESDVHQIFGDSKVGKRPRVRFGSVELPEMRSWLRTRIVAESRCGSFEEVPEDILGAQRSPIA